MCVSQACRWTHHVMLQIVWPANMAAGVLNHRGSGHTLTRACGECGRVPMPENTIQIKANACTLHGFGCRNMCSQCLLLKIDVFIDNFSVWYSFCRLFYFAVFFSLIRCCRILFITLIRILNIVWIIKTKSSKGHNVTRNEL